MHRSGTSLTAQWMHKCGINMGDDLAGPKFDNVQGFYEDNDFFRIHLDILAKNNVHYSGLEGNLSNIKLDTYLKKKIMFNIKLKNSLRNQWGWKDPRTCLFLEEYHTLIPNAYYLVVYRDHDQVVDSLLRRDYQNYIERMKKQGVKGKIKLGLKKRSFFKKMMNSSMNYSEKWTYYNQLILKLIENIPDEFFYVFNIKDIFNLENDLYDKLRFWGFSFKPTNINSIYDKKLFKQDIRFFDKKDLLNFDKINEINRKYRKVIK